MKSFDNLAKLKYLRMPRHYTSILIRKLKADEIWEVLVVMQFSVSSLQMS
jgi:hypothetical protein